jgi:hypothetical protein
LLGGSVFNSICMTSGRRCAHAAGGGPRRGG